MPKTRHRTPITPAQPPRGSSVDRGLGLFAAFAIEPVLIVGGGFLLWGGLRARRRQAQLHGQHRTLA